MDARQIETEIPIPIVEKESETVTGEIPASEKELGPVRTRARNLTMLIPIVLDQSGTRW